METVQVAFWIVAALVLLALAFDFMNGFHDAANSIATVVSTGVLKPLHAVAFAAFCNVIAIFVFKLSVAATVGKGIVEPGVVDHVVVFGAPQLSLLEMQTVAGLLDGRRVHEATTLLVEAVTTRGWRAGVRRRCALRANPRDMSRYLR